jgi:R-phenyllactate dehydratase, small subunit
LTLNQKCGNIYTDKKKGEIIMRANEIYSKNRKEKKMTDKETNFLKELDLLYQQDEEVSLDLVLELYENFEPFKIEAEKTGEGKEDEVRELYYKIGDRYFFLRVYSDKYDIDFDIMAKFELDLETVKSLNLLNYENF